jgi:hypothetical protein
MYAHYQKISFLSIIYIDFLQNYDIIKLMKKDSELQKLNETLLSLPEFLKSFNENIPVNFPRASEERLWQFKKEHGALFRKSDSWSLDQHRKKVIDWLPRNSGAL